MADRSTKLTVDIVGDASKGIAALRQYEAATRSASSTTSAMANKIQADYAKMERSAKEAAAANQRLGAVGSGGTSGLFGSLKGSAGSALQASSPLGALDLGGVSAGAAAAAAGVAIAGAAAVKFGVDAVQAFSSAAEAVDNFQDVTGATAEESSKLVGAAQALGVSSDQLAGGMAKLARNASTNEDVLREYGAQVVKAADGSVDLVATLQSVAGAYARTEDPTQRAILANAAFGKSWTSLVDVLERGGDPLNDAIDRAAKRSPIFSDADLKSAKDFQIATAELREEFTKLQVEFAGPLVDDLTTLIGIFNALTDAAAESSGGFSEFLKGVVSGVVAPITVLADLAAKAADLAGIDFSGPADDLNSIKDVADRSGQGLNRMGEAARDGFAELHGGALAGVGALGEVADEAFVAASSIYTIADAFASAGDAWLNGLGGIASATAGITAADDYESALSSLDATFVQAGESQQSYADTANKSGQQIADAQAGVQDALEGVAEAQADYQKAVEDAGRRVADVEESSSKRIVDAQDNVTEARRRAEEQALSSARRVEDATQAVRDAAIAALRDDDPFAASRRREEAELGLTRAKEDAAGDQQDAARGIAEAESDLADTERQAAKDRADAQRDAAEQIAQAQKRIEDANDRVAEANQRLARTTDEAGAANDRAAAKVGAHTVTQAQYDQAVQKTIDATPGYILSMAQRGVPLDEINTKLQGGIDKLREQGGALGLNTRLVDIYAAHAVDATLKVLNMTQATYNLYAKLQRESARLGVDAGIIAGDAGSLGLDLNKFAESHDTGGWLKQGLSLVRNDTGRPERVLKPAEYDALMAGGGGGTTNIVYLTVGAADERALASMLAKLERSGYVVKRAS